MTILAWRDLLEGRLSEPQRSVRLTVGVFDGLHVGHRKLLARVTERPEAALPVVLTFRRHPALVLGRPGIAGLILTTSQKLSRLAALGIGAVVLIDFSEEIGTLSGRAFIELLRGRLAIEHIVVGPNFRFGRNRDADVHALGDMLAGSGTAVEVVEPVFRQGEVVSSSRIRQAIGAGELAEVREMLAADHELDLGGVAVERTGPKAMRILRRDLEQVLPPAGLWPVTGRWDGGSVSGILEVGEEALEVELAAEAPITTLAFGSTKATKGAR